MVFPNTAIEHERASERLGQLSSLLIAGEES